MIDEGFRNIVESDEQKRRERQSAAWKVLMNSCKECSIDPISFANIIGISEGKALMFFKQGSIDLRLSDEQYVRLGRATNHSANFWKQLFEL